MVTGKYFKLKASPCMASLAAMVLLPGGAGTQGKRKTNKATTFMANKKTGCSPRLKS